VEDVRSALDWAQVKALAADGVSEREIARRLGSTGARSSGWSRPMSRRYRGAPAGSMVGPLVPVVGKLMQECPDIKAPRVTEVLRDDYGYTGSVDLVRERMAARSRRSSAAGCARGRRSPTRRRWRRTCPMGSGRAPGP
jgi:hypothetical protein